VTRPDDATRGPDHDDAELERARRHVDKNQEEALDPAADPELAPEPDAPGATTDDPAHG
jgi:hypothetical protein